MMDERGRSRGFGFVNYDNHEDAQKVKGLQEFKVCSLKGPSFQCGRCDSVLFPFNKVTFLH